MDFIQKVLEHFPRVDAQWLITGKQAGGVTEQIQEPVQQTTETKPKVEDGNWGKEEKMNKKEVERIIVFYTDRTFDTYEQS